MSELPEWYIELTKNVKEKKLDHDRMVVVDFLKKCLEEIEEE